MNEAAAATAERWAAEEGRAEEDQEFAEFRRNKRAGQVAAAAAGPDVGEQPHVPLNAASAKQLAELGWAVLDVVGQMALGKKYAIPDEKRAEFVTLSIPVVQMYVPETDGADALLHPAIPLAIAVGGFYLGQSQQPDAPASETIDSTSKPAPVEPSRGNRPHAPPRVAGADGDEEEGFSAPN